MTEIRYEELIINVALTGCVHSKGANANLPVTPREIAADARRCADEGASVFHLHARDARGLPTMDLEAIQEVVDEVRGAVPMGIVCVSCSGRHDHELTGRTGGLCVEPVPEMASLTLGSYNAFGQVIVNHPQTIQELAAIMQRRGIQPELEAFDTGHVHYIRTLEAKGLLRRPCWVNLFLGNLGTAPAKLGVFLAMKQALPQGVIWAGAGIGDYQYEVNQWAVVWGGQVRVGMEDSLWMDANKMEPGTNPKQVMRIAAFARGRGREPVSIDRAREILGMEVT